MADDMMAGGITRADPAEANDNSMSVLAEPSASPTPGYHHVILTGLKMGGQFYLSFRFSSIETQVYPSRSSPSTYERFQDT